MWRHGGVRLALATATLLVAMALPAAPGMAADYHVYSCRIPRGGHEGTPEPVEGTEAGSTIPFGWSHSANGAQAGNTCDTNVPSSRQALVASLPAGLSHSNSDLAQWTFQAPSGETITEATLWRAGDADGGAGYLMWLASPADPSANEALASASVFDSCSWLGGCNEGVGNTNFPLSSENEVKVPAANLHSSHIYMNASCSRASCPGGTGDTEGYAAVAYLYAADIVLEDPTPPTVTEVTGTMKSEATLSGEAHLHFTAADAGSGVYQTTTKVDNTIIHRGIINEEGGRCRALETLSDGEPAFLYAQPCPTSATAQISLNTTTLTNGPHTLLVEVSDAAGNRTVALERNIEVSNPTPAKTGSGSGPSSTTTAGTPTPNAAGGSAANKTLTLAPRPNGIDASAHARLTARWLPRGHTARSARRHHPRRHPRRHSHPHSRRSHRHDASRQLTGPFHAAEAIAGRLTTRGGVPIAQALLTVTATPIHSGARPRTLRPARTNAAGRFQIKLPAGLTSTRIRLSYASTIGAHPDATTTLTLAVRASLTLRVTPHRTSAGHTIHLSGAIRGGHIPPGGKEIILEARSKGTSWLPFDLLHTDRHGHFRATHRFRLSGPVDYRFRAVCPREADFPFTTGASGTVSVFER